MKIVEQKLEGVTFAPTPNMGGPLNPEYLIIHYTVTTSAAGTVAGFQSAASKASAHLVLDFNGSFTQLVPFNRKAWHAGASQWAGRSGCNDFTLGIEVVNPGPLSKRGDKYFDVYNRPWNGPAIEARHKNGRAPYTHWAAYTEEQMRALELVGQLLVTTYQLKDVMGHDDIAPVRKIDPGPAFPMESYRSALFGRQEETAEVYAATTTLNVRKGPGVTFDTVQGSPLKPGDRVVVASIEDQWWHVLIENGATEGWVHSRFLARA